jgi:hypothetical protein
MTIDDLLQIEGWAEFSVVYDSDCEPQWIDVDAVEIGGDIHRDRQINRGDAIRDNLPDSILWDQIRMKITEHLNDEAEAWSGCLDAAEHQGDLPARHPTAWLFGADA